MRFCPYCGAESAGDQRRQFCADCGEHLPATQGGESRDAPPVPGALPNGPRTWPADSLASLNARVAAWAIDAVVLGGLLGVLAAIGEALAPEPRYSFEQADAPAWIGLAMIGVVIGYPAYLQGASAGQTVGMRFLRLRVLRHDDGSSLGLLFGLVRVGCLIGNLFGIGLLTALTDSERRTLRDHMAGTIVVRADGFPKETWPGPTVWDGRTLPPVSAV